jgi:signal transduction histidine kinase
VDLIIRHDLKSPLNAIIGAPAILMKKDFPADQIKLLKMIQSSGHKMLKMINLSLDLFKMERGLYQFQPQEMDLLKVVNDIVSENQNEIRTNNFSITISIKGRLAEKTDSFSLKAEKLLCYSMLANLFNNAIEASPKGETIAITFEKKDVPSVSIHNRGEVPRPIRENFFGKYVTSGKTIGTGLGTYSAKLIAETQGGSIHLDTSEEKSTTVTVKFAN